MKDIFTEIAAMFTRFVEWLIGSKEPSEEPDEEPKKNPFAGIAEAFNRLSKSLRGIPVSETFTKSFTFEPAPVEVTPRTKFGKKYKAKRKLRHNMARTSNRINRKKFGRRWKH